MNYLARLQAARAVQKRIGKDGDEKKPSYYQRELYRGLTVPYSTAPGRKRIHPKETRK